VSDFLIVVASSPKIMMDGGIHQAGSWPTASCDEHRARLSDVVRFTFVPPAREGP
jgi:hypothetical protein